METGAVPALLAGGSIGETPVFGDLSQWAADILGAFGSVGLAAPMLATNLFPPIPSEATLPLAGFLVTVGGSTLRRRSPPRRWGRSRIALS